MGVTRRGFFKGALIAAALALVPSLPRLPKVAQKGHKVGRVVALPAPDPHFAECVYSGPGPSLQGLPPLCDYWPMPKIDNYGIADDESAIWRGVVDAD